MSQLLFITGGVRSGKTRLAEIWAESLYPQCLMLATCHGQDAEMAARIAAHRSRRGKAWLCLEEPLDPLGALALFRKEHADFSGAVALDSLGMWILNLMGQNLQPREILRRARLLSAGLAALDLPCAVVSEECGLGFIPRDAVSRKYGDLLGSASQIMAAAADIAILAVAGLPLALKGVLPRALAARQGRASV